VGAGNITADAGESEGERGLGGRGDEARKEPKRDGQHTADDPGRSDGPECPRREESPRPTRRARATRHRSPMSPMTSRGEERGEARDEARRQGWDHDEEGSDSSRSGRTSSGSSRRRRGTGRRRGRDSTNCPSGENVMSSSAPSPLRVRKGDAGDPQNGRQQQRQQFSDQDTAASHGLFDGKGSGTKSVTRERFASARGKGAEQVGNAAPTALNTAGSTPKPEGDSQGPGGGVACDTFCRHLGFPSFQTAGAPSHGWRNPALSGGGHRAMPARGENRAPRPFVSMAGPHVSYRLAEGGFLVRNRVGEGKALDRDGKKEESVPLVPPERSHGGVRSRKQPAMVRRLKNTLQAINGSV